MTTEQLKLVKQLSDFANGPLTALNELAQLVPDNDEGSALLGMVNQRIQSDYQELFSFVLENAKSA